MPLDWLTLAASGIALATAGPTFHSYISGFSLARRVDEIGQSIELLTGKLVHVTGSISKIADHHYGTNTLGVSMRGAPVVDLFEKRNLQRPKVIDTEYVTECETEIDQGFSQSFLETPENFLHGICDISKEVPDVALLKDDTLVPWHFSDGDGHKLGFTKKGFLDHLGIQYIPLGEFDGSVRDDGRNDEGSAGGERAMFPAAEQSTVRQRREAAQLPSSMSRIKNYRGQKDFTGIHEYSVRCPHCETEADFPSGIYVERYLKLRCASCREVFLGEVLRTNLSLRFYKDWKSV